jgi:2-dehydro-3-deoxyphosphogluconate aldolase / (4S)-4-hydroxy-2-oxoglutarate aldolase
MALTDPIEQTAQRIRAARIIPVLRAANAHEAKQLSTRLLAAGIGALELTATIPGWPELLAAVRAEAGDTVVGVGTVTTAADAELALERGADFLVSPYPAPAVRPVAAAAKKLFVEGGLTPAELAGAASRGVAKLFPAYMGGVRYLRSILAVLPSARIVPTGGIPVEEVPRWLAAGAFGVGVGSDLYAAEDLDAKIAQLRAATAEAAP